MKFIVRISRIIAGAVFIFSGFVKGIDPLGTAYKFSDYFAIIRPGLFDDLTLPLSVLLCMIEFVTGMMLVSGAHIRLASWAAALFMSVFTPLTLYLAIFNPVSDCGCFGDAVHMTNWQTFIKNIIITVFVAFVFMTRHQKYGSLSAKKSTAATSSFIIVFLAFAFYNLLYLPVIDFRPYKPGTNLPDAMTIPPGAPVDKYDVRFIYEKAGEQKEFTLNDYPANDTSWHFVDQKSVLVSEGYKPPVHDFSLTTSDGHDVTPEIINDQGYTILMISEKLEKANRNGISKGINLGRYLEQSNTGFYIVTSSAPDEASLRNGSLNTLYADETTLKTIIRSNPGFVLLHNGTIMAKWPHRSLPPAEGFVNDLNSLSVKTLYSRSVILIVVLSAIVVLLIIILIIPSDRKAGWESLTVDGELLKDRGES